MIRSNNKYAYNKHNNYKRVSDAKSGKMFGTKLWEVRFYFITHMILEEQSQKQLWWKPIENIYNFGAYTILS